MGNYTLNFGDDYPLNGNVTHFESYMFVTGTKHINEHRLLRINGEDCLDGYIYVIDGPAAPGAGFLALSNPGLPARQDALSRFNQVIKGRGLAFPNPKDLSCVMIDIMDDDERYDPAEWTVVADDVCNNFITWCMENDRAGAIVQHLAQGNRLPHVHALYERAKGRHNEFQDWLLTQTGRTREAWTAHGRDGS